VEIIIHQSLCGENSKKAWDLLQTTMPDISIARSIAFKADLQDQAGGVAWKPTIRGFMQDDYFLLMKTYPDKSPDVRPRRSFSHVLLISKKDIDSIIDIGSLFKYFPHEIVKSISIEAIKFDPTEVSGIILPNGFQERFNKAIHGFKKASDYKNTIIWVGEDNFEQAVFKIWQVLSPSEKENVNIGIYFNVVAIPEGKLNFITTPENIESKFVNGGFCLIRRNDTQILTEISEQFLAGETSAGQRIKVFQDKLETKQLSRADIDKIAIVIKTFEEVDSIVDLKKLNTLSHIIAEYSPDENKGVEFKEKLVEKIRMLIKNGHVTDIPLVKKFNFRSFKGSEAKVLIEITNWLDNNLFSVAETKKKDFGALFRQLRESTSSNWWTKLIGDRIKTFLAKVSTESATVIFNWLQADFDSFKNIQSSIDSSKESEMNFISQLPKNFDVLKFPNLREFALKRSWFKFHSTLLLQEHPFEVAISEQLKVDTDYDSLDGIKIILKGVKPKTIIDFTVSNGDRRLIDISGKLCHDDSSELERIDFTNAHWQEVWLKSISYGNKILDGFKEPQKKVFKLFDSMIDGNSVHQRLIEKISDTEFGNILNYKERVTLWSKFPSTLQTKFLAKTSFALLESLNKNSAVEIPTDKVLSDYIVKQAIGDFLYYNKRDIKSALRIFNKFSHLSESSLKDFVINYSGKIDMVDAIQLGKLVYSRGYSNVAHAIHYKSNSHNNWKVALRECYYLLGVIAQISIAWTGLIKDVKITEDQWWNALTEIACKLYGGGPKENKIWTEADGEEYDLLTVGTGKELWIAALKKLRNGGCHEITVGKLLKKMMKGHKRNEELKTIYDLKNKI
jgi:hypothetical protein